MNLANEIASILKKIAPLKRQAAAAEAKIKLVDTGLAPITAERMEITTLQSKELSKWSAEQQSKYVNHSSLMLVLHGLLERENQLAGDKSKILEHSIELKDQIIKLVDEGLKQLKNEMRTQINFFPERIHAMIKDTPETMESVTEAAVAFSKMLLAGLNNNNSITVINTIDFAMESFQNIVKGSLKVSAIL